MSKNTNHQNCFTKAIIIGAAPSITNNLDLLLTVKKITDNDSNILVFACDHILKNVLNYGINPKQIIACTTEATTKQPWQETDVRPIFKKYYDIPTEIALDIRVHCSCQVDTAFMLYLTRIGFSIQKDFHRFHMLCQRQIQDNCEDFREGYNVGAACIHLAARYYNIKEICTIGIDLDASFESFRQGELENTMLGLVDLPQDVKIYNCNPNREGRFYSPISESRLERVFKIE